MPVRTFEDAVTTSRSSTLVLSNRASSDMSDTAEQINVPQGGVTPSDPPITPTPVDFPEKPAVAEEKHGLIEFRVVNNDNSRVSTIILTGLKRIFQNQLAMMPKHYLARLVYDRNHVSIAIVKQPLEVVGGITYRPFNSRPFAETVFCAISSNQQVKGYGAHLMAHLTCRRSFTCGNNASLVTEHLEGLPTLNNRARLPPMSAPQDPMSDGRWSAQQAEHIVLLSLGVSRIGSPRRMSTQPQPRSFPSCTRPPDSTAQTGSNMYFQRVKWLG